MAFWSAQGGEPLRQYRWYMTFGGVAGMDTIRYALKKTDKPKAKINSVQHKYINHFFNYPGRLEWEDINVTFASITAPSADNVLWSALTNAGYGVPSDGSPGPDMASIGKNKFNNAIGNTISLIQINSDGNIIEKWNIYRPFFTSVQFGALDYSSEEIVEITCTLKYDWAKLEAAVDGVDAAPGASPGFAS